MGVDVTGLIWGSLKFILIVSSFHFTDTMDAVVELLDDIIKGLPALQTYVDLFGSSDI